MLIATEPAAVAAAAGFARAAGLGDGPGGVLAVPEGPNERGLHALGYRDDAATVLQRAEDGTLQMLIALGDADPLSRFPEAERWEAALQRCESVVASSLFPTPTALWAHVILPATAALEKDGTITNLEGRTQRLRPALPLPRACTPSSPCSPAQAGISGLELDESPSRAFRRIAEAAPLFAGLTLGCHRPERAARRPTVRPRPERAAATDRTEAGETAVASRPRGPAAQPACARSGAARSSPGPPSRAASASRSSAATRSCSRAPMRCGSASPRALPWTVRHAGGTATGTARLSRTLAPGAVRFAWDGAPVDGACTVEGLA